MTYSARGSGRRLGAMLALAVAAALMVTAFAAPGANAELSWDERTCNTGEFCMWQYDLFDSPPYDYEYNDKDLTNDRFYYTNTIVADNVRSLYNHKDDYDVIVFDYVGFIGSYSGRTAMCVDSGTRLSSWALDKIYAFSMKIASYMFVRDC